MKKEKTECREVVVALLSQRYEGDKTVGEWVVNPKRVIRDSNGKCIGYASFTLNDLCNRNPADEWMELVVRAVELDLLCEQNDKIKGLLCRNFEMLHQRQYSEYYKKEIITLFLYYNNILIEVKKYDAGDTGFSLHRMSNGEFIIMNYLHVIGSISFTKEVYKIMNLVRQDYEQILNGTMDYFLGFSMSEEEFIKFVNSRFVFNRTIKGV